MADPNLIMRCAYLASERGAVVLPSPTTSGDFTITSALDNSTINADAVTDDVVAYCAPVDPTISN